MKKTRFWSKWKLLGIVALVVSSVHLWYYGEWVWPASPETLAAQALTGATVHEKAKAAVRLSDCGHKGAEQLRRVLRESDTPEVRAACILGLCGIEDYESMDLFVELMADESFVVRGSAGAAVTVMVQGHDPRFLFRADDPEEKRQKAIESLSQRWEELRGSPLLDHYRKYLKETRGR